LNFLNKLGEAKDAYEGQVNKLRDKAPLRIKGEYYGGYSKYPKSNGSLYIYQDKIKFVGIKANFAIEASEIREIAVEGKEEAQKRVTVTRLFATGIFAFALQKKSIHKEAYITITTADGEEAVFHVQGQSNYDLKPIIAQKLAIAVKPARGSRAAGGGADELEKLAGLKDKGIITQAEFDAKKKELLGL